MLVDLQDQQGKDCWAVQRRKKFIEGRIVVEQPFVINKNKQKNPASTLASIFNASFPYPVASYLSANQI